MYLNKEAFKRYFFYGDENPEKTLEGIMFFVWQNIEGERKGNQDEVIKQFVQEIKPLYRQYYRFIELNNRCNVYNYRKEENEEELEARIYEKIEELRNTNEIVTEEEIQGETWKKTNWRYKILQRNDVDWSVLRKVDIIIGKIEPYNDKWSNEEKAKWINQRRQEWQEETLEYERKVREKLEKRRTKKLIVKENKLTYSLQQRIKYAHFPEGSMTREEHNYRQEYVEYNRKEWGKDTSKEIHVNHDTENKYIPNVLRHWTEDIYDILKVLAEIEESDPKAYTDLWLRTRQNRAKNGTINGIDEEEIARINHACEKIRKIRLEEEQKGMGRE